jgi:hypothetical protein
MSNNLRGFKKLTGDNWVTWSYAAKQRFIKKKIWDHINPKKTPSTHTYASDGTTVIENPAYQTWLDASEGTLLMSRNWSMNLSFP